MNQSLRNLYSVALPRLRAALPHDTSVSQPLFLEVPEDYTRTKIRLMVVGQETFGWGESGRDSLHDILSTYRTFDLGRDYRRSPFWQAAHWIHRTLNPEGPERAFLWSNLVKVDQARRRPSPQIEEAVSALELLPAEIEITRPDVVVFFTGPHYDQRLERTFPGVRLHEVVPGVRQLDHAALPYHSYRTYHPAYLRRSRQWHVLDQVVGHIQAV